MLDVNAISYVRFVFIDKIYNLILPNLGIFSSKLYAVEYLQLSGLNKNFAIVQQGYLISLNKWIDLFVL